MRRLALVVGWLAAGAAFYLLFLLLDFYWNIVDWKPRWDGSAWLLFLGILAALAGIRSLARASRDRLTIGLSCIVCLALALAALYAFPPEPLVTGLFARQSSSPLWYRGLRVVLMTLPFVFLGATRRRASTGQARRP